MRRQGLTSEIKVSYEKPFLFPEASKVPACLMLFRTIVAAACLLLLFPLVACGERQPAATIASPVAEAGRELFREHCAVCHGTGGEGQPGWQIRKPDGVLPAPPLNGDGHTWHHGDGTLFRIVSQGGAIYESPNLPNYRSGMPAFGEKLSRDEMVSVINYLKILWGDKRAQGLDLLLSESQAIVSETDPFPDSEH